MEKPDRRQERDINELLANGFFKTSRARSPSPYVSLPNLLGHSGSAKVLSSYRRRSPSPPPHNNYASTYLKTSNHEAGRARSRSRVRYRGPPPPRPTVEDEVASLARESSPSSVSSYDPPCRGVIDQYPIILESDISDGEEERLNSEPRSKDLDDNPERRFVLVPGTDASPTNQSTNEPTSESKQPRGRSEQGKPAINRDDTGRTKVNTEPVLKPPPRERKKSRHDLPNIQTKVPRSIPSQYRRSASAHGSRDHDEAPKAYAVPHTSTGEYFLSPDAAHTPRDQYKESLGSAAQPGPRNYPLKESSRSRGNSISEKRDSESTVPSKVSRLGTTLAKRRDSGNFEVPSRSRRNSNDRTAQSRLMHEDLNKFDRLRYDRAERKSERPRSPRRTAPSNLQYYSSSEDDLADSGSEREHRRRRHEHRRTRELRPDYDYERGVDSPKSNRSSNHSKFSSPLPSPKIVSNQLPKTEPFERAETFPQGRRPMSKPVSPLYDPQETPRADRLNPMSPGLVPRPSSRQSNAPGPILVPQMEQIPAPFPHHVLPIAILTSIDPHSVGENRRITTVPQYENHRPTSTRPAPNEKPYLQPSPSQSQFPPNNPERHVGSYRSYAQDVGKGNIAELPSCPRRGPIAGYQDWLTLPQCPHFNICPGCFNSIIAPTAYRNHFMPARRAPNIPIACDFGTSPWYRIAWLLITEERKGDLSLFYGLANVGVTEQACLGKREASNRSWNSIIDPKTDLPIDNFDVCHSCARSIEILLPPISGIFFRTSGFSHSSTIPRICDLRYDSKRFSQYFNAFKVTADDAAACNSSPNTRVLAKLAQKFSILEECQGYHELSDRRWYIITQLPEFTVCEECFDDVVYPELEDGKAIPLMFNKIPHRIQKASCQLYSNRMRTIFRNACDFDDYMLLATKARERRSAELAWKVNVAATKRQNRESMVPNPMLGREIQRLNDEWTRWE